ncbi:MAG: hypothetical protein IT159_01760 [Bryobacterales bacterium]|jgi:L-fucose mutarotase/ribose pyranase (RbsD/FucU family)|nr:hypothetical protein [Bryobacterales bacterium]
MTRYCVLFALGVLSAAVAGCGSPPGRGADWKARLRECLPLYGHRNWIVVADSAYPAQSRAGIETVISGAGQLAAVQEALTQIASARHVRPVVYTDQELEFVREEDAPGISAYRQELGRLLKGREVKVLPHEQIISRLDEAGETFRVLIIKTGMTLPYTSVFLQLDCGYWTPEAEQRLRASMAAPRKD